MKLQHLDKKRLILIDLDGTTLMNDGKTIHPKTQEVIKKAVNVGHKVCIITGPPPGKYSFLSWIRIRYIINKFWWWSYSWPLKTWI